MQAPILYFDSFGPVEHVVREVEARVPMIFGESEKFIDQLKKNIREYAANQGWDTIALSLSKGLARFDLDELLDNALPHDGPIVVDPTGSTPEHQTYHHYNEIKSCRERLVRVNEASGDIMIILYGLASIDSAVSRSLLMRRLRVVNGVLDMMGDEWAALEKQDKNLWKGASRTLAMARDLLGIITSAANETAIINYMEQEAPRAKFQIMALYAVLHELQTYVMSPNARLTLVIMLSSMGAIPQVFNNLDLDWTQRQDRPHLSSPTPTLEPN